MVEIQENINHFLSLVTNITNNNRVVETKDDDTTSKVIELAYVLVHFKIHFNQKINYRNFKVF